MPIGSRSTSSCRRQATAARTPGADGSTLPSTRRTISSNGRPRHRFRAVPIVPGLDLWSCFCLLREPGQVQVRCPGKNLIEHVPGPLRNVARQNAFTLERYRHMESRVGQLNSRFEIPGTAQVVGGNGRLPKVRIASREAVGEMYLHGAHVTCWKPFGREEVLFLSSQSRWEDGQAIRGGVPVCFPWFGNKADDPKAPAHGFVRTRAWQIESIEQIGSAVTVSMFTESNEDTTRWWPAEFRLVHRATFGRGTQPRACGYEHGENIAVFRRSSACVPQSGKYRKGASAWSRHGSLLG